VDEAFCLLLVGPDREEACNAVWNKGEDLNTGSSPIIAHSLISKHDGRGKKRGT
jgi:hypothetical protein